MVLGLGRRVEGWVEGFVRVSGDLRSPDKEGPDRVLLIWAFKKIKRGLIGFYQKGFLSHHLLRFRMTTIGA